MSATSTILDAIGPLLRQLADEMADPAIPYADTKRRLTSVIATVSQALIDTRGRLTIKAQCDLQLAAMAVEQGDIEGIQSHILSAVSPRRPR